jgi:hypothetical protein
MLTQRHSYLTFRNQENSQFLAEIMETERRWVKDFLEQGLSDQYRGRVRLANGVIRTLDRTDFSPPDPTVRVDIDALELSDGTTLKVLELDLCKPKRRPRTIAAEAAIEAELRAGTNPGNQGGPTLKEFARTIQGKTGAPKPYSTKHMSRLINKVRNRAQFQ